MKLHIGDTAGTLLTRQVEAAPTTAFGLLAREACARRIARFFPVTDRTGGPRPHKGSFEQWLGVIQRVADQGCEARACCFARADRRPRPEEIVPVGVIQVLGPGVCGLAFGSEGHAACSRRTGVGGSRAGRPIRQARWPSHRASVLRLAQPAHTGRRASRSAFRLRRRGCCLSSRSRAAYAACRRAWWASGREPPIVSRSVRAWERPKRRKIAPAGLRSLSCCFMPVTTTGSVPSYMWRPSS